MFSMIQATGGFTTIAQKQEFENDFQTLNFPDEFLPNWYGNEVRTTASRIFQVTGQGRNNSKALAVQPISTFDGKIWAKFNPSNFENPALVFYAKTTQNGTGSRPVLVFYSLGESLEGDFSDPIQLGTDQEFANENRDFRKYEIALPPELIGKQEAFFSLDIRYGPGTGSAARWVMDDVEFGDIVKDDTPPQIVKVKGYDSNALMIAFSEKVDPVFSILPLAYELEGENPSFGVSKNDSTVLITFDKELESAKNYSLSIRQIPDLEGNFLQDTLISFTFFDPTFFSEKSLVINEIMPAPRAEQDLPNAEFIEIYHKGEQDFRLEGIRLSNSRSEAILDEFWISPGDYLILAPENLAFEFFEFGPVLPVKNWPALLNSGDKISLSTAEGIVIDRISYATASWGGSDFANGGYSLEVSNPAFLCENSVLLRPSISQFRGTPGAQNSVFDPNFTLPLIEIESAFFQDSVQILVIFSSPIIPQLNLENLEVDPLLEFDSISFNGSSRLQLFLKTPADKNLKYKLTLRNLKDCFGNDLEMQTVELVLPDLPKLGEIIINEVLFDPKAGDSKFVELKNKSQNYLSLENWALANINSEGLPDQFRIIGEKGLVLPPDGYLAITTDVNSLKSAYPKSESGNFLQVSSLPSYPISGGTVVLLSPNEEIAEKFEYSDELHHPLLRDTKGVSLERISANSQVDLTSNWQSASGNEDFATPGRKNSQTLDIEFESSLLQIDPEIFDPEGSGGPAFCSIRYQLAAAGWVGNFKIYSAAGQLIQTLAQNQILGTEGLLTWTGTDSTGKLVRSGYYILVVELYEPGGEVRVVKKTIVVASRL